MQASGPGSRPPDHHRGAAGSPKPEVVFIGELDEHGNLPSPLPVAVVAWAAFPFPASDPHQVAVSLSALCDIVGDFVNGADGTFPIPVDHLFAILIEPPALCNLPVVARCAVLVLAAQAYSVVALRTRNVLMLEHALDIAEQAATQAVGAGAQWPWIGAELRAMAWSIAGTHDDDPFRDRAYARVLAAQASPVGSEVSTAGVLSSLPMMLESRFEATGQWENVDAAISAHERVLAGAPAEAEELVTRYDALARLLMLRYERTAEIHDLDRAIAVRRLAISAATTPSARMQHMRGLVFTLWERTPYARESSDLAEIVELLKRLIDQMPTNDPSRPELVAAHGMAILQLGRRTDDSTSIDHALERIRAASDALPDDAPELLTIRRDEASALRDRAQRDNSLPDIELALELLQRCVDAAGTTGQRPVPYLISLGLTYQARYRINEEPDDLDRAIEAYTAAKAAAGEQLPNRLQALRHLCHGLTMRLASGQRSNDTEAITAALTELREADPNDALGHSEVVYHLRRSVVARYMHVGDKSGLDRAITVMEWQVVAAKPNSPTQHEIILDLADLLWRQYGATGNVTSLHRATDLLDDLLAHVPTGSLRRSDAYKVLGMCLRDRYQHEGDEADLDRAIAGYHKALSLANPGDTLPLDLIANLSLALWDRYKLSGSLLDLDRAINLADSALAGLPKNSEMRATALNTLGIALGDRANRRQDPQDAERAVHVLEEAVSLLSPRAPTRSSTLNNLGGALLRLYGFTNDLNLLNRGITAINESVESTEPSQPDRPRWLLNLAAGLHYRYRRTRQVEDLRRGVDLARQSVAEALPGWSDRAACLMSLGQLSLDLYQQVGRTHDRNLAIESLRAGCRAALDTNPGAALRFAGMWSKWAAGAGNSDQAAEACDLAITAMTRLVKIQFGRKDKEAWIDLADGIPARGAYAHAMRGDPKRAVEVLEGGRALQLSEAIGRDDEQLAALVATGHSAHVARFRRATAEFAARTSESRQARTPGSLTSAIQQEGIISARQAVDDAVADIREIQPDFLQPPDFTEISAAARAGPLVYVTPTAIGGLALIVWGSGRLAKQVETVWLPELTDSAARRRFSDLRRVQPLAGRNAGAWRGVLDAVSSWLWDTVMAPLVDALRGVSRVVLIPTGHLSMLPLHAAWTRDADYPSGRRYAIDELVISYAPNARVLAAASAAAECARGQDVLVVESPYPSRHEPLPFAAVEAAAVGELFGTARTRILRQESATLAAVEGALGASAVVHFACHGIAHLLTPLKSALILAGDEALTLEALLRPAPARQHPNTRLAVLSACESLLPGVALPDEVISLPTGLLQAGVAGIIATQWKISGLAAALMVIKFYTEWLHQPTKPAAALQSAARWLRDSTNAEKAAALNPLAKHESLSKPTVRALWRQIVRLPPEQRSFAHLSDWAAFAYVGA